MAQISWLAMALLLFWPLMLQSCRANPVPDPAPVPYPAPVHGVIPYYKELKEERYREEHIELLRDCNRPTSTNPRCAQIYEAYMSSGGRNDALAAVTVLALVVTMLFRPIR